MSEQQNKFKFKIKNHCAHYHCLNFLSSLGIRLLMSEASTKETNSAKKSNNYLVIVKNANSASPAIYLSLLANNKFSLFHVQSIKFASNVIRSVQIYSNYVFISLRLVVLPFPCFPFSLHFSFALFSHICQLIRKLNSCDSPNAGETNVKQNCGISKSLS